jgi:hypothetical protein
LNFTFYKDIQKKFHLQIFYQAKKLFNPEQNGWNQYTTRARISRDGLTVIAINAATHTRHNAFAVHAFPAATPNDCRLDNFPGTIIYYFEVKQTTFRP